MVAMRVVTSTGGNTLYYLHTDHLGSTSLSTCGSGGCGTAGALVAGSRQSYYPYGAVRTAASSLPTDITFTGQRSDASTGLMFYNARYYSPVVGRFVSADTVVPGASNPQAWNRYAYTLNNPVSYTDPSGHCIVPAAYGIPGLREACIAALQFVGNVVAAGAALVIAGATQYSAVAEEHRAWAERVAVPEDVTWSPEQIGKIHEQPTPTPEVQYIDPRAIPTPSETPESVVRVRHYSGAIAAIQDQMLINSGDGLAIFAEYPITTGYNETAVQNTTQSFMRPLNGAGGFVEFNVDLNVWQIEPDPNLAGIPTNANPVRIRPRPLALMNGFPLNGQGVDPVFYNWKGELLE